MKKLTLILLCSMLLSFTLPGCVVTDENGNTFMFLPDLDIDDGPHGPPPPPPPPSRHGPPPPPHHEPGYGPGPGSRGSHGPGPRGPHGPHGW